MDDLMAEQPHNQPAKHWPLYKLLIFHEKSKTKLWKEKCCHNYAMTPNIIW